MRIRRVLVACCPLAALGAILSCSGDDTNAGAPTGPLSDATTPLDASSESPGPSPLWDGNRPGYDSAGPPAAPRVPVAAELVSKQVDVQGMMFSAGEMQISGEPFAEFFAGRNLNFYDRTFLPPDMYLVPDPDGGTFDLLQDAEVDAIRDVFGFSTAVESYEYSKYHQNSIIQFSGAGVSLANGPLVGQLPDSTIQAKLVDRSQQLLTLAGSDVVPPPVNNPFNITGFAGHAPVFAPYRSFDPTVPGSLQVIASCQRGGGYGGIPTLTSQIPEYECEYNQLHVPDSAVDHTLVPAVLGFAQWKQALWSIDFAGRIHDANSNPVNAINPSDQRAVGTRYNQVVGTDPPGAAAGTYLGSTPLEGMWGLHMVAGMDNLDEWLLTSLMTTDGSTLGGFASKLAAIQYDYSSPLIWFPAAITVAVAPPPPDDAGAPRPNYYPPVTGLTVADATSRSIDLAAILLGAGKFFAMTDSRNVGIGQRIGLQILFDGDHGFTADDGLPDGEETAHDRALGLIRAALVDLNRLHADPRSGVITDTATIAGGVPTSSGTVTTTSLAHVIVGLREALLSCDAAVNQYGAAAEDPSADASGILNSVAIHPPGSGSSPPTFSTHLRNTLLTQAQFVRDVLTDSTGKVANGATLSGGVPSLTTSAATLESQAAAARALTEAFLLTSDDSYRDRARAVVQHLHDAFWSAPGAMFRGSEGGKDEVNMTPERFGWLQSCLRETHKTLSIDGDPLFGRPPLEAIIARINTLYMNGWDDIDGDGVVDHGDGGPDECLSARMQQGEQALTGELGRDAFGLPTGDRDSDCVPELAHAQNLSVFASDVHFHTTQ
jgi:hypothetical protein